MDKYTELYAWIWTAFGTEDFSMDEFRSTFPVAQGPKVAHDLVAKGYLKRVGRGRFRALEPKQFIERITEEAAEYTVMEKAGKDYAFCDSTAVTIWTDGYYWTGFTRGFKPANVAVRKGDMAAWAKFFRHSHLKHVVAGERRTLYGQVFVLHPRRQLTVVRKNGWRVIPLDELVRFCLRHELIYEPALEYLDEKYHIGYGRREHNLA